MNEKLMEQIVAQVLSRLKKQVLVVLSPAQSHEQAIYQRLMQMTSVSFTVYATDMMSTHENIAQWASLGNIITKETINIEALHQYHCIFLPFIGTKAVGEVANGLFISEESQLVLQGLSQDIPIMALKYHCCPESELNQILGLNKNEQYNNLIKDNIKKAILLGVQFDSFNNIEEKLLIIRCEQNKKSNIKNTNRERYITLKEVMDDPGIYCLKRNKLTDSAIDYLKSLNK